MKITSEVEIDWINEEGSVDEIVEGRIFKALITRIEGEVVKKIAEKVAASADKLITAKTEMLINTTLEQPCVISKGWNKKEEYESIYDMVEKKMSALYEGKLGASGECKKDPLLANIETTVKNQVSTLLKSVENIINKSATNAAKKEVREHELFKTLEKVVTIK